MLFPLTLASAKKNLESLKITVVEQSEGVQKHFEGGFIFKGEATSVKATVTKAVINGDHALLKCYENHSGCNILAPGEYDAEMAVKKSCRSCSEADSQPDVWIKYIRPVDHKEFREHWKGRGLMVGDVKLVMQGNRPIGELRTGSCGCPHGCGRPCDELGRCPFCWNDGNGCPVLFHGQEDPFPDPRLTRDI